MFGDMEPLLAWKDMCGVCVVIKASREHKESWSDGWNKAFLAGELFWKELVVNTTSF